MNQRRSTRGCPESYVKGHLKLDDLKSNFTEPYATGYNKYIHKENIPIYPRPEFHVSHLKHDTGPDGVCGVFADAGIRDPKGGSLVWWSLSVGPDDLQSAEQRLLEDIYPGRTEEHAQTQHREFLRDFATSPAFLHSSRMGSFRFTFPLDEVLQAYSEQFCSGARPVMRAYETVLYKQEMMYVVLVHSPANQDQFSEYPLLSDVQDPVCSYKDGRFIWRSQAMCENHRYKLVLKPREKQIESEENRFVQFYVWDHVAVVLHVKEEVLDLSEGGRLRENLLFCEGGFPTTAPPYAFIDFSQAEKLVETLWPEYESPLEKVQPL